MLRHAGDRGLVRVLLNSDQTWRMLNLMGDSLDLLLLAGHIVLLLWLLGFGCEPLP